MPITINETADNECLKGLVNAHTGLPVEVRIVLCGGGGLQFMSPDAYSPSHWVPTMEQLAEEASARNGVVGAVSAAGSFVCPYTGNAMALEHDPDAGFRMSGGWDPALCVGSAEEFAYRCAMRGGKPDPRHPKPSAKPSVRVVGVKEEPEPKLPPLSVEGHVGEAAEKAVHGLRKAAGAAKVRVSKP